MVAGCQIGVDAAPEGSQLKAEGLAMIDALNALFGAFVSRTFKAISERPGAWDPTLYVDVFFCLL